VEASTVWVPALLERLVECVINAGLPAIDVPELIASLSGELVTHTTHGIATWGHISPVKLVRVVAGAAIAVPARGIKSPLAASDIDSGAWVDVPLLGCLLDVSLDEVGGDLRVTWTPPLVTPARKAGL
jgi:hypothetical protein